MDISNFTLNELKDKIIEEHMRYFLNKPYRQISIHTEIIIVSNMKNNPKEVSLVSAIFVSAIEKNFNYVMHKK